METAAREPAAGPRRLSAFVAKVEDLGAALGDARRARGRAGGPPSRRRAGGLGGSVDAFGLEDQLERGRRRRETAPGPSQVLDALLLLAETRPDPDAYLAAWDRLRDDEGPTAA